jgi:hypothetical protein
MSTIPFERTGQAGGAGRVARILVAAFAVVALAGCASSQGKVGATKITQTPNGIAVDVILRDYEIIMPESIPSGAVTFNIKNESGHVHNFKIEVNGTDRSLERNLGPGDSGALSVSLTPGEYGIDCPVGLHSMRGMRRTLTVTGQPGT